MTRGASGRPVKPGEAELFASATAGVKPLRHRPAPPEFISKPPGGVRLAARRPDIVIEAAKTLPALKPEGRAAISGMDGRNAGRLIRGRLEIEGSIDLHGHIHDAAQRILADFIRRNQRMGKRCVLVITGRGGPRRGGKEEPSVGGRFEIRERKSTLFDLVPGWLSAPGLAHYVVAFSPAQPKHGGSGALYVYLRRARGRLE